MGISESVLNALKTGILLNDKMTSLSEKIDRMDRDLDSMDSEVRQMDKRLIRLETMVEIAQGQKAKHLPGSQGRK